MVEQKAVGSYETYIVGSYTVSKRGGIHRFRTRAEASLWYGCDVAEVDGIQEGFNSILVWRGADGITYGSGEGLTPPIGVSYERAKVSGSEVKSHCKYKWEDTWESIFFKDALKARSYKVGDRRFETIEEAELYLSKYPGKGPVVKSGATPNSYLPPNSDGWLAQYLEEPHNPHTAVEVCLARGEADWVGHLRSQLTAEVTGMLEGAGFVVRMVSTNPFHMVGGVSLSEGDPKVYSGGFAIVEKEGRFVISSTSSWGRLLNETSHATPQGAAKALIQAFQDTKDFDAMDRAIEAGDKVASVNNKATSTEVSVISPCVSYCNTAEVTSRR